MKPVERWCDAIVEDFETRRLEEASRPWRLTPNANGDRLPEALLERVLTRLGLNRIPDPTPEALRMLYHAWCRCIPFDNVRKLIHLRNGNPGMLPAATAVDFFEGWLKYGTGGTCWAGAGASHALLVSLGFDAVRALGTMLVNPNVPPNHGTTIVRFHLQQFLFDSSILHGTPLELKGHEESAVEHPAWGVRCSKRDERWHIFWRPLNRPEGFECRLERAGLRGVEFETRHDQTRAWSPFNYQLSVRLNCGNEALGVAAGHSVTLHADGSVTKLGLSDEERARVLIEEFGLAEEIVARLPADIPTPPPPGSATAARNAQGS